MKEYLAAKAPNLNEPILESCTTKPLHEAVVLNKREMVRLFLLYKPDVDIQDMYLMTPLAKAASLNRVEIMELLFQAKANPFLRDETGKTPRDRAVYYRHREAAEMLKKYEIEFQKEALSKFKE